MFRRNAGLALVELTLFLLFAAILIGGVRTTLAAHRDSLKAHETELALARSRDALLRYATRHGRLPCPAHAGVAVTGAPPDFPCMLGDERIARGALPYDDLQLTPIELDYAVDAAWADRAPDGCDSPRSEPPSFCIETVAAAWPGEVVAEIAAGEQRVHITRSVLLARMLAAGTLQ